MNEPTIKLYNQDSHMQSFCSRVITCNEQTNGDHKTYIVTLEATAFFPEGGGQPADKGTLGDAFVYDVQEDDGIIYHTLSAPMAIGETVTGTIDWTKRFDLMQHHTAEHIISGLVHKQFGYDNIGFHMGSEAITIDFNGNLMNEDIRRIEFLANEAVYKNIPIEVSFPSSGELNQLDYRSKKELSGDIRIVSIPEYDICACCAPHVALTGEIGSIKITSCQKYKSGVRISMLCGTRALADYILKEKQVYDISVLLSAKPHEVSEAVTHLKQDNLSLKGQVTELQNQLLTYKALEYPAGTKSICVFDNTVPVHLLRNFGNLLLKRCTDYCAVFINAEEDNYKYLLASKNGDVRPLGKLLNDSFNGKGGGSKEMVQGSITCKKEEIEKILADNQF